MSCSSVNNLIRKDIYHSVDGCKLINCLNIKLECSLLSCTSTVRDFSWGNLVPFSCKVGETMGWNS